MQSFLPGGGDFALSKKFSGGRPGGMLTAGIDRCISLIFGLVPLIKFVIDFFLLIFTFLYPSMETLPLIYQTKRKQCPGCKETFSVRYFNQHLLDVYNRATNRYSCFVGTPDDEDGFAFLENQTEYDSEESTDFDIQEPENELMESNIRIKEKYAALKSKLNSAKNVNEQDRTDFFDENIRELEEEADSDFEDFELEDEPEFIDSELQEIEKELAEANSNTSDLTTDVIYDDSVKNVFISWIVFIVVWHSIEFFIVVWQLKFVKPDTAIGELLNFFSSLFVALASRNNFFVSTCQRFPKNVASIWKLFKHGQDNFRKYVVCPSCCKLYKYEDCFSVIRNKKITKKCN